MNNLGFSKDSVNIGDFRIKGQGETLRIGDDNGGDGYVLPTEKGTIGQVITMNADNTTSFKDIGGGGGSVRVWTNSYSILTNPTFGGGVGIPTNIDSSGSGSKNYTDINFPVGSQLHIQACGSWNINNPSGSCDGQFVLGVGGGGFTITDVFNLVSSGTIINEVDTGLGFWSVDVNIVRVGATSIRLGRVSVNSRLTSTSTINVPIVNSITNNPNGFTFGVPAFPFDINLQWIDQSGGSSQCFPVAGTYNHNVINATDTLITTTNPSLDHNTLSNLTTGDPHNQYTKNGGRSGGQTLSGGLTGNNLVLKSHDIGLPNVTIKPLNTQFNKNIDMDANDINNVKDINGRGGLNLLQVQNTNGLFYLDGAEIRMTADTSINLYPTTNLRLGNGGQDISINPTTKTDHFGQLDMIGNSITNCNRLFCSDYESTTGFITFFGLGGGVVPSFTSSGLDMNLGNINNVTSINGLTAVGGLFSGTSDSLNVSATTAEISILPLTFVGVGFGVPPNGFSVGDCFSLNLSGPFNSNNNDTLTIRLKGGPTSTTLLSTLVVPLNASSGSVFQLSVTFQIRAIGGAGVADIVSDSDLTYNQSGAGGSFVGEQSLSQNNTTFDTTVPNILDVTAQFSSNSANNDMTTRVSKLQKTF